MLRRERIDIAKSIFEALLRGENSRDGVAIKDCRGKEVMVLTRYGGDIILTFYDVDGEKPKFRCVFEMTENTKKNFSKIFLRFVELKSLLRQE